ncbi:hypothetical protein OJF2_06980 [Aquisphaera giovannonii]|uniref:Antitoxin n=1 Tax=Aquisphaera giovannonii TaxID=406548 RepID=A0A5B9VVX0_9BACT|nr:hypothetical protein [Aquisphaera giovannonii]QEH32229.1 hypothetical protein OJF2_06980 [Aquisphaera giovannonii]
MSTITLQQAQATVSDLVHRLASGEEDLIIDGDRPVARRVLPVPSAEDRPIPRPGTLRGSVLSPGHLDDPPEDFRGSGEWDSSSARTP